jgi:hypothetical protein
MNVVRHDGIPVEIVVLQNLVSVVKSLHDHVRDFRDAKVLWTSTCVVEKTVHRKEGLPGGGCGRETAIRGKAAM